MSKTTDLRAFPTVYEARHLLPDLAWLDDDSMKALPIWKGRRFETNHEYFDLTNPARGPFVGSGDEGPPTNHTYVCRDDVPEQVWSLLITWQQPVSRAQGEAIESIARDLGMGVEQSAAGEARPAPPV